MRLLDAVHLENCSFLKKPRAPLPSKQSVLGLAKISINRSYRRLCLFGFSNVCDLFRPNKDPLKRKLKQTKHADPPWNHSYKPPSKHYETRDVDSHLTTERILPSPQAQLANSDSKTHWIRQPHLGCR